MPFYCEIAKKKKKKKINNNHQKNPKYNIEKNCRKFRDSLKFLTSLNVQQILIVF